MNVTFINPKFPVSSVWLPLGPLYLVAYLRKYNPHVHTNFLDANVTKVDDTTLPNLLEKRKPDLVAIGAMTPQAPHALKIGETCRRLKIPTVCGGVHFTALPHEFTIPGEGEYPLSQYLQGNTPTPTLIPDLDSVPFPAYEVVNVLNYADALITKEKAFSIITGRGCPYHCSFCASPLLWQRHTRFHSIPYLQDHLQLLISRYKAKNIRVMDDTFCCNKKRVIDFCEMIQKNNFKLNLACTTHVKTADLTMFQAMKDAGFVTVALGVKSGSPKILKLVNKNITPEEVEHAVYLAHQAGLQTECLWMLGNIGETAETVQESINLQRKLKSDWDFFQYATPFPGTPFYDHWRDYGTLTTTDFSQYYDNKPVFIPHGTTPEEMCLWMKRCRGFA